MGCAEELDNDLALREALANAILHGNRSSPDKAVRICIAVQDDCGMLIVVKMLAQASTQVARRVRRRG